MSRSSIARLLVLACIWGSSFLFMEIALGGLTPAQVVLGRVLGGAAILVVLLPANRLRLPRGLRVWGHVTVLGVVANLAPYFLFATGQQRISSGLAGVLNGTTPLFTLGFAVMLLAEERLSLARVTGLLVGFSGVVLLFAPWRGGMEGAVTGIATCLGGAACYGAAMVYTRRFMSGRGIPPLVVAGGQLAAASVIGVLASPLILRTPMQLDTAVVGSVLVLGVVATGVAFVLLHRLIGDAGATSASMTSYLIPAVAVTLGAVLLAEPVTWNIFVGAAVIVLGIGIAEQRIRLPAAVNPAQDTPTVRGAGPL